jgi:hypothetical protein
LPSCFVQICAAAPALRPLVAEAIDRSAFSSSSRSNAAGTRHRHRPLLSRGGVDPLEPLNIGGLDLGQIEGDPRVGDSKGNNTVVMIE